MCHCHPIATSCVVLACLMLITESGAPQGDIVGSLSALGGKQERSRRHLAVAGPYDAS